MVKLKLFTGIEPVEIKNRRRGHIRPAVLAKVAIVGVAAMGADGYFGHGPKKHLRHIVKLGRDLGLPLQHGLGDLPDSKQLFDIQPVFAFVAAVDMDNKGAAQRQRFAKGIPLNSGVGFVVGLDACAGFDLVHIPCIAVFHQNIDHGKHAARLESCLIQNLDSALHERTRCFDHEIKLFRVERNLCSLWKKLPRQLTNRSTRSKQRFGRRIRLRAQIGLVLIKPQGLMALQPANILRFGEGHGVNPICREAGCQVNHSNSYAEATAHYYSEKPYVMEITMSGIEQIIQNIAKIVEKNEMGGWQGGILYSSKETLAKGDIYFMGYNPGGLGGAPFLTQNIEDLCTKTDNAYLDEEWAPNEKLYARGEAPLQKRVRYLFEKLGIELRGVCATNLIFAQSRNADGVDHHEDARKCWDIHRYLINEVVKPKIIICMGNGGESAYTYLWSVSQSPSSEEYIPAGHGEWTVKAFQTGDVTPKWIVGFPHFSYYKLEGKANEQQIIQWVREKINRS